MHVTLVGAFNPLVPSAGGSRSYVESLATFLRARGVPHSVIVSGPMYQREGNWCVLPVRKGYSSAQFLAALTANLKSMPCPPETIVHVQRPDHLLPFLCSGRCRRYVCTLHGSPLRGITERRNRFISAGYAFTERVALSRADRVISVDSRTTAEYVGRLDFLKDSILTIPNGVDTSVFRPMDQEASKKRWGFSGPLFLYAGRLEPEKRVITIVKTFRALGEEKVMLAIAGNGTQRAAIESEAAGQRVRLLGDVPRAEMPFLINAADAIILFSVREGLPSVGLEALACGVPVITTREGSLPDVVVHGKTGYLVSSEDELRAAMEAVIDGTLRRGFRDETITSKYDWRVVGEQILAVYDEVWRLHHL